MRLSGASSAAVAARGSSARPRADVGRHRLPRPWAPCPTLAHRAASCALPPGDTPSPCTPARAAPSPSAPRPAHQEGKAGEAGGISHGPGPLPLRQKPSPAPQCAARGTPSCACTCASDCKAPPLLGAQGGQRRNPAAPHRSPLSDGALSCSAFATHTPLPTPQHPSVPHPPCSTTE